MKNSIKNFLLESKSDMDESFVYFDKDVVCNTNDVDFNVNEDYIIIDFSTTYGRDFKLLTAKTYFLII
jgi:hypothetical protein